MASGRDCGKIIVLTGAGASAALGLPTMAELLQMAYGSGDPLKSMARSMVVPGGGDIETVYESLEFYVDLAARADAGDRNLSNVFGNHLKKLGRDAAQALSQLQGLILSTCGKVDPATDAAFEYGQLLAELRDENDGSLCIFTLNYDLAYESFFGLDGVVNGMRAAGLEYVRDPEVYEDLGDDALFVVYRLHGCSHWFRDPASSTVLYQSHPSVARAGLLPMVVFPSRSKVLPGVDDVYAVAYRAFQEALAKAEVCVVIGCSFRDKGVVGSLVEAEADTQFIVVDPALGPDEVRQAVGKHSFLLLRTRLDAEGTGAAVKSAARAGLDWTPGEWSPPVTGLQFHYSSR